MTKSESLELNAVQVSRFQAHLLLNVEHTCLCANWPAIQKHMSFCLQVVDEWSCLHNLQSSLSPKDWLKEAKYISGIISNYVEQEYLKPSEVNEILKGVLGKIANPNWGDPDQVKILKKIINFGYQYFRNHPETNKQIFSLAEQFMDWLMGNCEVCKAPPPKGGWRFSAVKGEKFEMKGLIPSPEEILERVGDNLRLKQNNYFARDKLRPLRHWFDAYHYWLHHIKNDPLAPRPGHHKPYVNASAIENVLTFDRVISAFLRIIRSFNSTVLKDQLSLLEKAAEKAAIESAINSAVTYECFRNAVEQLPLPAGIASEERRIQIGLVWLFIPLMNIVEPTDFSNKDWLSSFAESGALFLFDVLKQGCQSYAKNKNAYKDGDDINKIYCSEEQEQEQAARENRKRKSQEDAARLLFAFMSEITKLQAIKSDQDLPAIIVDCLMPIEVFYDAVKDDRGGLQLYSDAQFQAAFNKYLKIKDIRAEKEIENKKSAPHLREYFFDLAFHDLIGRRLKKKKPVADVFLVMEADSNEEKKTVSPTATIKALKTRYLPFIYEYRFQAFVPSVNDVTEQAAAEQFGIDDADSSADEQSEDESEVADCSANPLSQMISAKSRNIAGKILYAHLIRDFNRTFKTAEKKTLGGVAFWLLCDLPEKGLVKDFVKNPPKPPGVANHEVDDAEKLINLSKRIDQSKSNNYITDDIFLANIKNYSAHSDEKKLLGLLEGFQEKFPAEMKLAIGYVDTWLEALNEYKLKCPEVF